MAASASSTVTLVTGGARSGKSRFALALAEETAVRRVYVATAEPLDEEMRRRIERHRAERGEGWSTVEEPADLGGALAALPAGAEVAVVDCLTVWLGNLLHRRGSEKGCPDGVAPAAEEAARARPAALVAAAPGLQLAPLAGPFGEDAASPDLAEPASFPEIAALLALLDAPPCPLVLVTNEVGWGIVPGNAVARAFRDLAGRVNEEVARRAERVVLMVAGRPLELPGGRGG